MNIWHKRFLYLQIILMVALCIIYLFYPQLEDYVLPIGIAFFFIQLSISGAKANENPEAVFYKKSCVIAMIDSLTMIYFIVYFSNLIFDFFTFNPKCYVWLFLYIAIRKYYIIKNYSYEK